MPTGFFSTVDFQDLWNAAFEGASFAATSNARICALIEDLNTFSALRVSLEVSGIWAGGVAQTMK